METLVSDSKKNFIVLGGCHVAGQGAQGNPSFIDILENYFKLNCVFKKSQFQLQHIERLRYILGNFQSDLIILQLGNNEYNVSLKEVYPFLQKFSKGLSNSLSINKQERETIKESSSFKKQPFLYYSLSSLAKLALMPILWKFEKKKNEEHLLSLKRIMQENEDKTFVVISPFPCYHSPSTFTRKKAGSLFRHFFCLPNVVFFNSFEKFSIVEEMFLDRYHLNANGHEQMGKLLCEKLKQKNIVN